MSGLATADVPRTLAWPEKFGRDTPFLNEQRAQWLIDHEGDWPDGVQSRMDEMNGRDTSYVPYGPPDPWHIPPFYDPNTDPELVQNINLDLMTAVDMANRWRLYGEEDAAVCAINILTSWSGIQSVSDSTQSQLTGSNRLGLLVQSAMQMRDHASYTTSLDDELKRVIRMFAGNTRAFVSVTNHSAWSVAGMVAFSHFLDDRDMFDLAISRWFTIMENQLEDNIPFHEIYRQGGGSSYGGAGLYYCTFWLNAMVNAAEWARFAGTWLYDTTTRDGSTLEGVWRNIAYWTNNPHEYPYNSRGQGLPPLTKPTTPTPSSATRIQGCFDPLHALYPDENAAAAMRTLTTNEDFIGSRGSIITYRGRPLRG